MSLNRVQLIGHLGRDPEVRRTSAGNPVVTIRLATSESWKDKATGERKEKTEWHTVVIFNENLAKIAESYTRKGAQVFIEGQLQTRKWQDQAGNDRYSTEIVLGQYNGTLQLLDKRERQAPSPDDYGQTRTREDAPNRAPAGASGGKRYDDLDDDIPF